MPTATYFLHECPVCGRKLQVRVEYLGARVGCPHCRADFDVKMPRSSQAIPTAPATTLLERAEHLLATVGDGPIR